MLGIPVEMVQFLLELLLKQIFLAVHHDFHWLLIATKLLTAKLHSLYVKESESEILESLGSELGVGNFGKVGDGSRSWIFYLRLRNSAEKKTQAVLKQIPLKLDTDESWNISRPYCLTHNVNISFGYDQQQL